MPFVFQSNLKIEIIKYERLAENYHRSQQYNVEGDLHWKYLFVRSDLCRLNELSSHRSEIHVDTCVSYQTVSIALSDAKLPQSAIHSTKHV